MLTKEEYEERINRSELFGLGKGGEPIRYETTRRMFLKILTEYYVHYVFLNRPLESYSLTLIETACECIRYYDGTKGEFLHLFNAAMKREMRIALAKEQAEKYRKGIRLSGEDADAIRKLIAFTKNKGLDIHDVACQEKIARFLGVTPERVVELIAMNEKATAVSNVIQGDDGEADLFDTIVDKENSAEEDAVNRSAAIELLNLVEVVFLDCQERQKRMFSLALTSDVVKAFDEDIATAHEILNEFAFCSEEWFMVYRENGKVLTAREIARICGVSEQSFSRAYKNFKQKIRKRH